MSSDLSSMETRLAQLEREVLRLKLGAKIIAPKSNWISAIAGTAKDDPVYQEIVRLGKEIRDSEEPPEES